MFLNRRAFLRLGSTLVASLTAARLLPGRRDRETPGKEGLRPGRGPSAAVDMVAWAGDATQTTAEIAACTPLEGTVGLALSLSPDMTDPRFLPSRRPNAIGWNKWAVTGLAAGTRYYHQLTNTPPGGRRRLVGTVSTFTTLRPVGVACTIRLAVGSCMRTSPAIPDAFFDMAAWAPDRSVHLGDLGYPKALTKDPVTHMENWALNARDAGPAAILQVAAMDYIVSDHDDNGTGAGKIGNLPTYHDPVTRANITAWQEVVPARMADKHEFPRGRWRSDVEGNVRFVKLDTRCLDKSDTTVRGTDPRSTSSTMLGKGQLRWLKDEIDAAVRDRQLIVLYSDCAWNGTSPGPPIPSTYTDKWPSYIYERDLISDYAAARGASMIIVFGDSHGLQQDDGEHEKNGFASLCCGPFDQRPHMHYQEDYQWSYPRSQDGSGAQRRIQQYHRITIEQQPGSSTITVTAEARDCSPWVEGTPKTVRTMTKTYDMSRAGGRADG